MQQARASIELHPVLASLSWDERTSSTLERTSGRLILQDNVEGVDDTGCQNILTGAVGSHLLTQECNPSR